MRQEWVGKRQFDLRQIYFIVTRRCNLECSHCIRDSSPSVKDELTLEVAREALRKLGPYGQNALLLLTGGEPTLHSEIVPIAQYASSLFRSVMINTNGLSLRKLLELTDQVPRIQVQISLDGARSAHQEIRGNNTFAPVLRNIGALTGRGAIITIATTVSSVNLDSLKELDDSLSALPFVRWTLKRQVDYNRGACKSQHISTQDWNDLVKAVLSSFSNRHRIEIQPMFGSECFRDMTAQSVARGFRRNCGTGRSKLYVNPDLTVFPCACLEEIRLGDLQGDTVPDIINRLSDLPIEPRQDSPCVYCPVQAKCMGGCPGASLRAYGAFGVGDPRCPAIAELLQ